MTKKKEIERLEPIEIKHAMAHMEGGWLTGFADEIEMAKVINKINELVEAVNELTKRKI